MDLTEAKKAVSALRPNTKLVRDFERSILTLFTHIYLKVWLESPTNPTLKVVDIRTISNLVHQQEGVLVAVDNTFLSSYFQVRIYKY